MSAINPPLTIIGNIKEANIYRDIPYAILEVAVVAEELEKSGCLKCLEGSDDLDEYIIASGRVEGIAFHFLRYRSRPKEQPAFSLYIDSDAFKKNGPKNFQPYFLAYQLLEHLEIPWNKVSWVNTELQSPT